jgi:nucleoside-diphosphate-sugar epimerase
MKILLTGGTGFLGQIIYNDLILSNNIVSMNKMNFLQSNLYDNFDCVIHCAGKAHFTPKTKEDNDSFFFVNVELTKRLLLWLHKDTLPKCFVYISSVSVYGLSSGTMINEDYPLLAKDPYGKSKIEAELLVQQWCSENGVICTILRLPLVIGKNPPGNLGSMLRGIEKGYYFNINGGNSRKSMVLATDIASYVLKIAKIGGIYNLTDGINPTFCELSNHISKQFDKSDVLNIPNWMALSLAKIGDLYGENFLINTIKYHKIISTLTFDDSKARKTFDWNPTPILHKNFI